MGNVSTTFNRIFLFELQPPFERIEFQFVPEELNWDRSGNWVNVPIPGRNNSRKHLTGGEDKLTLSLDFNSLFADDKQECIQKLTFLQSLTMNDGYSGPARNVKLAWGESDLFRHKIWVVRRVGGKMSHFHSNYGLNPMQLVMEIELELDPTENTRIQDVRLERGNTGLPVTSINDSLNSNANIA